MTIYQSLYNLVEQYIFGAVSAGSHQDLVCILVATIGSIAIVALPFMVVWGFFRRFL